MTRNSPTHPFSTHRAVLKLAAILLFAASFGLNAQDATSLKTERNYAAARAKAKSDGRLLFVMFEANDCKHCARFTEKVLSTTLFRNFARDHLALVFYNFDTLDGLPESEQKVADQFVLNFDIKKTPAILVFTPDGKNVIKTKGYRGTSAEKIVKQLQSNLPK